MSLIVAPMNARVLILLPDPLNLCKPLIPNKAFVSAPMFMYPPYAPDFMERDASEMGAGAVLSQYLSISIF